MEGTISSDVLTVIRRHIFVIKQLRSLSFHAKNALRAKSIDSDRTQERDAI
jgi:hypothetical protein